ncbi:unnamed protein product [Phytophthora fragariaefolia]|uniref:Unnamed protein product n=1 Tax=Phytophthora fragariaefolia TaxID=1490495 RepID=A0A9W7D0L0_9STRA|nr:unnamed protein product [Phytophthora fragariaefolia]
MSRDPGVYHTKENNLSLTARSPSSKKRKGPRPAWSRYTLPPPNEKHRPKGKSSGNGCSELIDESVSKQPSEEGVADANTAVSEPDSAKEGPVPSPKDTSNARKAKGVLTARSSQEPSESTSAPTPAEVPQGQSSLPEDGPGPVDYEESEPDQDREQREAPGHNTSPSSNS